MIIQYDSVFPKFYLNITYSILQYIYSESLYHNIYCQGLANAVMFALVSHCSERVKEIGLSVTVCV